MKFLLIDIRKRVGTIDTPHYAVQRIIDELTSRNIPYDTCHYDEIELFTNNNELTITAQGQPISTYSHIIMRGHRTAYEYNLKRYIVSHAQKRNIIVQNANFIASLPHYNKLVQMIMLTKAGLPWIDSYYCLDGRYWEKEKACKQIGFPLIYKHVEGEYKTELIDGVEKLKKNVYLVENIRQLEKECRRHDEVDRSNYQKDSCYFIQKYVATGEDYRAIMIGKKWFGGWKRVAEKGFLTVSKDSSYSPLDTPEKQFLKLATDTAEYFDADYCAVDIIYNGNIPHILEVNMNPGFKAFETKLGEKSVDVAQAIVDQMLT